VITIETTTTTDVNMTDDGTIIPPEDLNGPSESKDAQKDRLDGTDALLELEKLKTLLAQMQKALDAEKGKSQALEKQLNQVRRCFIDLMLFLCDIYAILKITANVYCTTTNW
jgi:hypothetical protein